MATILAETTITGIVLWVSTIRTPCHVSADSDIAAAATTTTAADMVVCSVTLDTGNHSIAVAPSSRELATAGVRTISVGGVTKQVEEQLEHLGESDDRDADPKTQLTADVGKQLAGDVVLLFDGPQYVRVGDVDVETGEVAHRLASVGVVEVAPVESLFLGVGRVREPRRVVGQLRTRSGGGVVEETRESEEKQNTLNRFSDSLKSATISRECISVVDYGGIQVTPRPECTPPL